MAKEPKHLSDVFQDTLKDIYFAEKKILTALPTSADAQPLSPLMSAGDEPGRAEVQATTWFWDRRRDVDLGHPPGSCVRTPPHPAQSRDLARDGWSNEHELMII
jgi:hypothetical protein